MYFHENLLRNESILNFFIYLKKLKVLEASKINCEKFTKNIFKERNYYLSFQTNPELST